MNGVQSLTRWLYMLAAVVVPFALVVSYIVITREYIHVPDWADWVGYIGAVAAGVYCVLRLPIPQPVRVLVSCLYVPVCGWMLFCFWLSFVGSRYGIWL